MTASDVDQVRAVLVEQRADLLRQIEALDVTSPAAPDFDENFADSAQVAAEQGENHVLAAHLTEQLNETDQALARLDDGSYGRCEVCDQPISAARLEALPATRFCIDHA